MKSLSVLLVVLTVVSSISSDTPEKIKCLVCKRVVQEMENEIAKVNPSRKINLGHRLNDEGKIIEKTKQFARSEMHLSELMDSVCEKMDNYVRARSKKTKQIEVIPLLLSSGGMNPDLGTYDIVQDADLNKSLKFYCESIVEEYENSIYDVLHEMTENPDIKLCVEATNLCEEHENSKSEL